MLEKLTRRVTIALKALGASQILSGLCAASAIFLFVSHETLEIVGEEIMMPGQAIQIIALFLMFFVVATGAVSILRVRWGWLFSFLVATVVLVMALLMGPGTISVTKWSFLGLMILSLVNWATAVVYYYHDLYT
jgi:hypothetical protein